MDNIANKKLNSLSVLQLLNKDLNDTIEEITKKDGKFKDNFKRDLGFYPKTQHMITAYLGKFGPVLCLNKGKEKKYVSIKDEAILKTITLEEAVKLLQFPKILGKINKKEVKLCKGKYGPYLNYNKKNIKFPRESKI